MIARSLTIKIILFVAFFSPVFLLQYVGKFLAEIRTGVGGWGGGRCAMGMFFLGDP